jgi:signal transduction histidine kinase/GAF domain-containing protein
MATLQEASTILISPVGSTAYYFLLLLAVGSGLWMAWSEWHRARSEHAQRWLVAMGGIVAVRVIFVLASLVASLGLIDRAVLLPPLERLADVASIGFLAWALLPHSWRRVRGWDWFFGVNLALAVVACVTFTILWAGALASDSMLDYNAHWQATVWAVWELVLIAVAMLAIVRDRGTAAWGVFLSAMVLLFAGAILQLLAPANVLHLPLWQRWVNLIAYPLVAVAIYQDIFAGLRVHSREMQDISQASFDQIKNLLRIFDASRQMSTSLDLAAVLDSAVRGIARVLHADQCAIVFPDEGDVGTMRLVAIYNPVRQGRGESVTFPLEYQLTVQQAIRRRQPVVVEASDNVQLKVLFALMGSGETGPLLVQPLLSDSESIGAVIAGNSVSRRAFSPDEIKLCQSMAQHVVNAIINARLYRVALDEIASLKQAQSDIRRGIAETAEQTQERADLLAELRAEAKELRSREEAAREARNALEIQLVTSRAEVEALAARLMILETDLAQAHARAEAQSLWYEDESARMRTEWGETVLSVESSQNILYGMTAGVLVTDVHAVIQDANFAAEILLDRSVGELQSLALQDVSSDERWQQAVITASGGEAVRVTIQMGINTLMCDLAPLLDPEAPQDEEHRLIVILQDVTAEVEEQRSKLETVATLAHELRTPITTIISYADMLLGEAVGMVGSAQRKYLTRIKAGAERMASMTDDLTQEAGVEEPWSGLQRQPQRQPVDVNSLIEASVASSQYQLEDRELSLELELPDHLPAIQADPDHMRHVLSHLLSNACLASTVGGQVIVQAAQSPTVPLDHEETSLNGDGFLVVSISDSGGGLSEEALTRVFDRARPSGTPEGLGESGAELSLARTLVEAHGGRLWVESKKGVGTTFSLVLPVNNVGEGAGMQAEAMAEMEPSEEPG